jgi:hypothetical protein
MPLKFWKTGPEKFWVMSELKMWSPSSWRSKPIAQVSSSVHFITSWTSNRNVRLLNTLMKNIWIGKIGLSKHFSYLWLLELLTWRVLAKIGTLPPLVTRNEVRLAPCKACKSYHDHIQIERLRFQLSLVQRNEAFLLHAGDCAESFDACTHVSCVTCIPNIVQIC